MVLENFHNPHFVSIDAAPRALHARPKLVTGIGVLALFTVLSDAALSATKRYGSNLTSVLGLSLVLVLLLGGMVYVAAVMLSTRDVLADLSRAHALDRLLCRYSGAFLVLLVGGLVSFAAIENGRPGGPIWLRSWRAVSVIHLLMEAGFLFSVITLCRAAWWAKPVIILLVIVFGMYTLLMPIELLAGHAHEIDVR